jgi:serine/threonine protein kinase
VSSVLYLIGKTLGKYEVLEHIGHGGMSEVYKGQHAQLDRMVAVKVLHPFLAGEEGFVTRFKREARIVATLRHPNIMQVYDFDYNEALDIYYMVMEYIDGPTLKTRMTEGLLPQEEAVRIGIAIADALDYAHQRGMVHRDVKPANIMFMQDGQPVLTDFGIAKMLTLSGLTASGAMVGTPAYMAPEVGMGRQGTAVSDIYSLGVVLYQMLTGQLPFESDSPMGMVMQHINDTPPPLARFVQLVPQGLEAVILKAMAKDPEERFGRAAEMAAALRQVVGLESYVGSPAVSPPPVTLTPPPVAITPPPASRRPSTDEDDLDEDDRLLRTWPVVMENKPSVRTPTLFPLNDTEPPSSREKTAPRRRSFWSRLVGVTTVSLVGIIVGVVVWLGIRGDIPLLLQQLQALTAAVREPVTMEITQEIPNNTTVPTDEVPLATVPPTASSVTATPSAETTPEAMLSPAATPVSTEGDETPVPPTSTPASSEGTLAPVCIPRVRLNLVRQEPDSIVLPDATVAVYLSARNVGDCTWPEGLRVAFVSGDQMGAPDAIPMQSLVAGASTQVIVPLRAPLDAGVYTSTWEVRQGAEPAVGTALAVIVEVSDDGPTPTPTPQPTNTIAPTSVPLTLEMPTLVTWGEDAVAGTWYGTLTLQAAGGGAGDYRYYRGEIQPETLLPEGQLTFSWRRCEALPLTVWVVSGADVVRWEGWVDYPAAQNCQ